MQVVRTPDLAGRVTAQRQTKILGRNPAPIVGHLDTGMAALLGLVGRLRPLGDCWQAWAAHLLGLPAWWAQVLARPGRPVSPGRLDDGRVKGGRRPSRRDAERP